LYPASLKAGERSGELEQVIRRYITYTRVTEEVRRKVTQAMVYPAILLSFSFIVVYVLITYAIPRFAEMFNTFDKGLPTLTVILIEVSKVFNQYWWATLSVLIGGAVAYRAYSQSERGRIGIDRFKLRLPLVGKV